MSRQYPPDTFVCIVQPVDTFFRLAQRFNTAVSTLIELNPGVNPDNVRVGQQICVPRPRLIYANRVYKVAFMYPANWQVAPLPKYISK